MAGKVRLEQLAQDGATDGQIATFLTSSGEWEPQTPAASAPVMHGVILVTSSGSTTYATIALAIAAASSGDLIWIGPGSYAESFTIPAGVTVRGIERSRVTIAGAVATGTRVTMGIGSVLSDVGITMPTDATPVVSFASAGAATIRRIGLIGAGAPGIGVQNSGVGTLVVNGLTYLSGTAASALSVTNGTLVVNLIDMAGGTLTNAFDVTGGTLVGHNLVTAPTATIADAIEVGAATVDVSALYFAGPANAIHITSSNAEVHVRNAHLGATTWNLLVDGGVTGGSCHFVAVHTLVSKFSAPAAWKEAGDIVLTIQEEEEDDAAWHIWGELHVGTPEVPKEAALGGGDSYTRGMMVVTTDENAAPDADGGNLTDVSTEARSSSGSTFTFQGTAAGHAIYVGSSLEDTVSVLKHWGWKVRQATAGSSDGAYIFEIWNGSAYVEINVMATEADAFYRYANEVFLRATREHLRFGITSETTWATRDINGDTLYWVRVRITSAPTTAPVFERFKLSTSRMEVNPEGTFTAHGRSRWHMSLLAAGNIFGESGGVIDNTVAVGSGGIPTGWDHSIKNSLLNQNADAIYLQFVLPLGIDTSLPLDFHINYMVDADTPVQMILSVLPQEVSGVDVADPAGGVPSLPRTAANTDAVTANAAVPDTFSLPDTTVDKVHLAMREPFDISDYYEGDIVWVRLELDDDGAGNANVQIVSVEVGGSKWTLGGRQ